MSAAIEVTCMAGRVAAWLCDGEKGHQCRKVHHALLNSFHQAVKWTGYSHRWLSSTSDNGKGLD
jgi:hypothetical protein